MSVGQVASAIGASLASAPDEVVCGISIDSRRVRRGDLFLAIRGETFDGHDFIGAAAADGAVAAIAEHKPEYVPPGMAPLVVTDVVAALQRLACHHRRRLMSSSTRVIAITGSNGKTTTKSMIDHLLQGSLVGQASPKSFNNHLGVPLTLMSARRNDDYLLVELGTNAPGEISSLAHLASPEIGVITSIGEAHLEGLGDMDGVAAEKASMLSRIRRGGIAFVNVDRSEIRGHLARPCPRRCVTFGESHDADVRVNVLDTDLEGSTVQIRGRQLRLRVPGRHHAVNAAAAALVAEHFGLPWDDICNRMARFALPPGRGQSWHLGDGTVIVDDTYNANPVSMAAAIQALAQSRGKRRVLVMGDMLELGDHAARMHERMVRLCSEHSIELLVAVGERCCAAIHRVGGGVRATACDNAAQARTAVGELIRPGDVVWVKGSRAMGLDAVVAGLRSRRAPRASPAGH